MIVRAVECERCGAQVEDRSGVRVDEVRGRMAGLGWTCEGGRDLCADCAKAAPDEAWPTAEAVADADQDQLARWYRCLPTADTPERAAIVRAIQGRRGEPCGI